MPLVLGKNATNRLNKGSSVSDRLQERSRERCITDLSPSSTRKREVRDINKQV
jgi:hypothetical protein